MIFKKKIDFLCLSNLCGTWAFHKLSNLLLNYLEILFDFKNLQNDRPISRSTVDHLFLYVD